MSESFLDVMRELKLREVEAAHVSGAASRAMGSQRVAEPGAFLKALMTPQQMSVIAEIKRASPSAGEIRGGLDAVAQATRYAAGGASAISVLTEPEYFKGSLDDLQAVSEAVSIPVMRKDFILDEVQIDLAVAHGASAVLLIAAFVPQEKLAALLAYASSRGLEALVEIFAEGELEASLAAGARILGVNARNLKTLEVDREVVLRLGPTLRAHLEQGALDVIVAESGIQSGAHASAAWAEGYRAALVGEALVRAPSPEALLGELRTLGGVLA